MSRQYWFTSDWHFDHAKIMKYCGRVNLMTDEDRETYEFYQDNWDNLTGEQYDTYKKWKPSRESARNMNDSIIAALNRNVDADDVLYCLGDFGWAQLVEDIRLLRDRIHCRNIHYIFGNHDKKIKNVINKSNAFNSCNDYLEIKINKQDITLLHYAMRVWNKAHYGAWHLHGHSHEGLQHIEWGKSLDVGVDCHYNDAGEKDYAPFCFDELKEIMDKRDIVEHH